MVGKSPVTGLYVHVPFCAHKCEYCAFYSHAPNGEVVNRYVDALTTEIGMVAPDLKPKTIFFGGGTPSLLTLKQWDTVLATMKRFNLLGAEEFTVECNPATVSADKARLLRSYGVNRISMGVQSLDEKLLDRLGRIHTRDMVFKSFDILRSEGFTNINLDLMFAIPGQTMDIWKNTLREIAAMQSEHLSCYEVIYEEDTPLFHQLQAGEFDVDEELACAMHDELIDFAGASGFQQYEVANFAKNVGEPSAIPSLACKHNVNYWRGGSFYGLGPSAAGYVNGLRTKNWSNTQLYCEQLEKGKRAIEFQEKLPPLGAAAEIAAFGLRMNAGWPIAEFKQRTGYDLCEEWNQEIKNLQQLGYATLDSDYFRLTRQGMRYADWAAELFLRPSS